MTSIPITYHEKLNQFQDQWSPKVIAEVNEDQFKLVKNQGEFVWHEQPDTDEAFIVLKGRLNIELPEASVELCAGELFVVPRGVRHKPSADHECHVLLIEPRGVVNTGDVRGNMTAPNDVWL